MEIIRELIKTLGLTFLVLIQYSSTELMKTLTLHNLSCARAKDVPSNMGFISALSEIHCASLMLSHTESALLMLTRNEDNGKISCGFSNEVFLLTPCDDSQSSFSVFVGLGRMETFPSTCSFYYNLTGVELCVYDTRVAGTYWVAESVCGALGGILVEARLEEDLDMFAQLRSVLGKSRLWFGGNDLETEGDFRWRNGDVVNSGLWANFEPNNFEDKEDCARMDLYKTILRLNDASCEMKSRIVCAVVCDAANDFIQC